MHSFLSSPNDFPSNSYRFSTPLCSLIYKFNCFEFQKCLFLAQNQHTKINMMKFKMETSNVKICMQVPYINLEEDKDICHNLLL